MQNFIPKFKHIKTIAQHSEISSKEFSFTDPLLSLKGKGLSMSKLENS